MPLRINKKRGEQLDHTRWLLTALVAKSYDEAAGGLAGVLSLETDWLWRRQLVALAWVKFKQAYSLPVDVARNLRLAYYVAVGDAALRQTELVKVLSTLNAAHLQPVVFKGAALAHTVYPDSACRPMGDIDIWLPDRQMDLACDLLANLGYHRVDKSERPAALMANNGGEIQFYGNEPSGLVELHWGVFPGEWLRRVATVDETAILQRCKPAKLAGIPALVLDAEDSLIQLGVHHAINHSASTPWVRAPIDITLLARHQPLDWSVVVQRAREWHVATATWLVLSLTVDLCGLTEAAEAARQLAPSRLRQKLIGLFANPQALVNMRDLSKSRWRYVYLLLMVDRRRDAVKLVYRALWPEDEWLQARYGKTGWRVRLQHLADAARGKI